jgi:hypothetical protein
MKADCCHTNLKWDTGTPCKHTTTANPTHATITTVVALGLLLLCAGVKRRVSYTGVRIHNKYKGMQDFTAVARWYRYDAAPKQHNTPAGCRTTCFWGMPICWCLRQDKQDKCWSPTTKQRNCPAAAIHVAIQTLPLPAVKLLPCGPIARHHESESPCA